MISLLELLVPLYREPDLTRLNDMYQRELESTSSSQFSYGSEPDYLAAAKAAFEKEETRYASLRSSASAAVTLTLTVLAGFVAFGDQYPPISQFGRNPSLGDTGLLATVLLAGIYMVTGLFHALRVLGATPRTLLGPGEFLPSAHLRHVAERAKSNTRSLTYSEWLAWQYSSATVANYKTDAAIALRMRIAMRAIGAALVLLVLATLVNTVTEESKTSDTIVCVVSTKDTAELCPQAD